MPYAILLFQLFCSVTSNGQAAFKLKPAVYPAIKSCGVHHQASPPLLGPVLVSRFASKK